MYEHKYYIKLCASVVKHNIGVHMHYNEEKTWNDSILAVYAMFELLGRLSNLHTIDFVTTCSHNTKHASNISYILNDSLNIPMFRQIHKRFNYVSFMRFLGDFFSSPKASMLFPAAGRIYTLMEGFLFTHRE